MCIFLSAFVKTPGMYKVRAIEPTNSTIKERNITMSTYELLKNTWIYQEIKQQIDEENEQQYLAELRQMLLEIVQARFSRIAPLTKRIIANIDDHQELRALIIKISIARGEKEARERLLAIDVWGETERE